MKKILFTLLTLLCCMTAAWAGTGDGSDGLNLPVNAEGYTEVRTGAEFAAAIRANNSAKIKLEADIDVSNLGTICDNFSGHIYGKYQFTKKDGTLKDTVYSLDGGGKGTWLFKNLENATIEHVLLYNMKVKVDTDDNDNIGALAKTANKSTFIYAMMNKVSVSTEEENDNIGGMIGHAYRCFFDHVSWTNSSVRTEGTIAGGVVGKSSYCVYEHCVNNPRCSVFAEGYTDDNYARSGGFAGYSMHDIYTECMNSAIVGGNEDSVGGFTGRSDGSDFFSCINIGPVVHSNVEDFDSLVADINKALDDMDTLSETQKTLGYISLGGSVIGGPTSAMIISGIVDALVEGGVIALTPLVEGLSFFGPLAAFWLVGLAATAITFYELQQHDEIGGISGIAYGGQFSLCSNRGSINCKDSQGGGIVGRAEGITANNCLNSSECSWGDDDCGGIIGEATEGCKVTNCLCTMKYPIMGVAKDMNTASGNNFTLKAGDNEWEKGVSEALLKSGLVAYWLNNGAENRLNGVKPWRQNTAYDKDNYPVLDTLYNEVTVADITTLTHITDAAGLTAFAEKVNKGDQFACAVLDDDIVVPEDTPWEPIGWSESKFRGVFDGQGHSISGLYNGDYNFSLDGAGLFGTVHAGAVIRNVTVKDSKITNLADNGAAGIVGCVGIEGWRWGNVIIENCASYANVYAGRHGGGILGRVLTKTDNDPGVHVFVENCNNGGTITTLLGNSGLLCGYTKHNAYIRNCWSAGELRHDVKDGKGTCCPYDSENSKKNEPEYLVGYRNKIDIQDCYIANANNNIDDYKEGKMQDGVTGIYGDWLVNGKLAYLLNGSTNDVTKSLIWQQNLGTDFSPVLGNKGVYHTRELNEEFGSICLPFAVESDDVVQYYKLHSAGFTDDNYAYHLSLEAVERLEAGEAGFYRTLTPGVSYTFCPADNDLQLTVREHTVSQASNQWTMKGLMGERLIFDNDIFYCPVGRELKNPTTYKIDPFHAYISGPSYVKTFGDYGKTGMRLYLVSSTSPYDVNFDNNVDVADVPAFINQGEDFTPFIYGTNAQNLTKLTNVILEK